MPINRRMSVSDIIRKEMKSEKLRKLAAKAAKKRGVPVKKMQQNMAVAIAMRVKKGRKK